jgi:hypothetical protein
MRKTLARVFEERHVRGAGETTSEIFATAGFAETLGAGEVPGVFA